MQVANTILNQLKQTTAQPVLWSWGWTAHQSVKENQIEGVGENYLGALKFKVSGMKFKGHVLISLAHNDTYTVSLGHVRRGKLNLKKQVKDVYFDELGQTIDELIERQDNYKF